MSDPVETRGPEIPESVYEKAAKAIRADLEAHAEVEDTHLRTYAAVARAAVDAVVAGIELTEEFSYFGEGPWVSHGRRLVSPWLPANDNPDV